MAIVLFLLLFEKTLSPIVMSGGLLSPPSLCCGQISLSEFASMRLLTKVGRFVLLFDLLRLNSVSGRVSGGVGAVELFFPLSVGRFLVLAGGGVIPVSDALFFNVVPFENIVEGRVPPVPHLSAKLWVLRRLDGYPFSLFSGMGVRTLSVWGRESGIALLLFAELGISFDLSLGKLISSVFAKEKKKVVPRETSESGRTKIRIISHTFGKGAGLVRLEGDKVFFRKFDVKVEGSKVVFAEDTSKAIYELAYLLEVKKANLFIVIRGKGFRTEEEKEAFLQTARLITREIARRINSVLGRRAVSSNYIVADDPRLDAPPFTMFVELRLYRKR